MGTTSTTLTVTIVTKTPDTDTDLTLEAEIVSADNDDSSTYYVSESYYLRLFKSPNITSISYNSNIGSVSLSSSDLTASVPYDGEDDEYLVFTGSDTSDLDKVYNSNFSYSAVGTIYDENGNSTSTSLTAPTVGYTQVTASKKIYGVFNVTYTTKYDKYQFSSGTVGEMLIFFIGSSS